MFFSTRTASVPSARRCLVMPLTSGVGSFHLLLELALELDLPLELEVCAARQWFVRSIVIIYYCSWTLFM